MNQYKFPPDTKDYTFFLKSEYHNNPECIKIIDEAVKSNSSRLIIIKGDQKIMDISCKNDLGKKIQSYSITKSFLAFGIMFLIQDKKLKSVKCKVSDYIDSWKYGEKEEITIYDILTHTSGLDNYWDFDKFTGYDQESQLFKYNINVKTLSNQICKTKETGKQWEYNNTATQILCTLVKEISGMEIDDYLNKKLFKPLGIKNYIWKRDKFNNPYGPFGLSLEIDSYLKIGKLILDKGFYNKKKIIDNKFLNEMLKKRVDFKMLSKDKKIKKQNIDIDYGLCWWIYNDFKYANGYLGQFFVINRKKKMIALRLIDSKWYNKKFNKKSKTDKIHFHSFVKLLDKI